MSVRKVSRLRVLVGLFVVVPVALCAIPAQATSTSTWDYPSKAQPVTCLSADLACFEVPAGAQQAVITIADKVSSHVSTLTQTECGTGLCTSLVHFCDSTTVTLPAGAEVLYVGWDDPYWAYQDSTDGEGCADASAFGTTGTITVTWS